MAQKEFTQIYTKPGWVEHNQSAPIGNWIKDLTLIWKMSGVKNY